MIDLTPLEVRKKKGDFRRAMRGYDAAQVDDFLELVADRLDELVRENLALADRASRQDTQVTEYRDRERALTDALVTAQEMREEVRRQTAQEAELVRRSAEQDAERLRTTAEQEAERLRTTSEQEATRLRTTAEQEAAQLRSSAQQESAQLRATAHQESEALRSRAQAEVAELRTLLRQEREREEEALRLLRARQEEFLGAYRTFLEQELAELGALARGLGIPGRGTAARPPAEPPADDLPGNTQEGEGTGGPRPPSGSALAPAAATGLAGLAAGIVLTPEGGPAGADATADTDQAPPVGVEDPVAGLPMELAAGEDLLSLGELEFEAFQPEPFEPEPFHPESANSDDGEWGAGMSATDGAVEMDRRVADFGSVPVGSLGLPLTEEPEGVKAGLSPREVEAEAASLSPVPAPAEHEPAEHEPAEHEAAAELPLFVTHGPDGGPADPAGPLHPDGGEDDDEEVNLLLRNAAAAGYSLDDLDDEELLLEDELPADGDAGDGGGRPSRETEDPW
jgi:cell division initiation protein